jgi:hypothetical protein
VAAPHDSLVECRREPEDGRIVQHDRVPPGSQVRRRSRAGLQVGVPGLVVDRGLGALEAVLEGAGHLL